MNPHSGKTRTERHDARIEWMLTHQATWTGFAAHELPSDRRRDIVDAMKAAGLLSPTTNACDVRVDQMMIKARRIRAARAAGRS